MTESFEIEVAFARPDMQRLVCLQVAAGTTASEAVRLSGLDKLFPEIDLDALVLGIFGKPVDGTRVLRARDRVEVYRPLLADPKEVRRRRANAGQANKTA